MKTNQNITTDDIRKIIIALNCYIQNVNNCDFDLTEDCPSCEDYILLKEKLELLLDFEEANFL